MDEQVAAQNQLTPKPSSNTLLKILILFGIFFLIAGSAYAGYWYGKSQTSRVEPEPKVVTNQPSTTPSNSGVGETGKSDSTLGWEVYNSKEYSYSVEYPKGAQVSEEPYAPAENWGMEALTSFTVPEGFLRIDVRTNRTSLGLSDWLKDGYYGAMNGQDKVPSNLSYMVAGQKALVVYYPPERIPASWALYFQRGQKVFCLLYVVDMSEHQPNFEIYRHFLSSFKFDDMVETADILPQESDFR